MIDLEKRMIENDLVSEDAGEELLKQDIPLSDIDTFTIVEKIKKLLQSIIVQAEEHKETIKEFKKRA